MNRCLLQTNAFLLPVPAFKRNRPQIKRRVLKAVDKGDGSKPSVNSSKVPNEMKINDEKKLPLTKEVKSIEEKKVPFPKIVEKAVASIPKTKHFTNIQKFIVPSALEKAFKKEWTEREKFMENADGFVDLKITTGKVISGGLKEFVVANEWESIPEWEAYSCSKDARRSHLPPGIYQYVPKRGEGFPEDFVPFMDYKEAVIAKY